MLNKDQQQVYGHSKMLAKIRNLVFSFGDSDLLNDFIFTNYSSSITFFDDDMEKTALYLDTLSSGDIFTSYIKRTQNYELMSISYLPCYAFKKFCSGMMAINARHEYPRELRNMFSSRNGMKTSTIDFSTLKIARMGTPRGQRSMMKKGTS